MTFYPIQLSQPIAVAEPSKAWIVFDRSEVVIAGSDPRPGQGSLVCVRVFLHLCCPVFR
jgi:hypothetical protein